MDYGSKNAALNTNPNAADVTATIHLKGVMLLCINKANHCELGFIPCGMHRPVINISEIATGVPVVVHDPIPVDKDIYFKVIEPLTEGVKCRNVGNDTDFRFVPDFEGSLHGDKVNVDTTKLLARLGVTAGELYSYQISKPEYDLMSWPKANPAAFGTKVKKHGKITMDLALDIVCKQINGSRIDIIDNSSGEPLDSLKRKDGVLYVIDIDSTCESSSDPYPSDFRLYYTSNVIKAKDEKQFDFKSITAAAPTPEICQPGTTGKTDTFGLSTKWVKP
jgi:hypothetical protein